MRVISEENRARIVELRGDGVSWSKVAKQVGCAISTAKKIHKEDSEPPPPPPPPPLPEIREARVMKMCVNPRRMFIYFEGEEGHAVCIKKANNNHPAKSMVIVKKVEGEDDLYRIA